MKKQKKPLFGLILCINIFLSMVIVLFIKINENTNKVNENLTIEFNEDETSLSLVMVGDSLIHSCVYEDAKKHGGGNDYNFKSMLEYIKPIVKKFDLAYYNQETVLGGAELGLSSYPAFNSPYDIGDAMIDAGFNLVSLATNHTIDRGEKAVLNSRTYWNNQKDVLAVGSYSSLEERDKVIIKEKNNISYTMLNYTYGTNGISIPEGKEYLVNVWPVSGNNPDSDTKYQNYKEQVKKDIEVVRDKVDVLIVAMHWGVEYTHNPTIYEKDAAKYLADLGVDIIIGTHPHVIQPVEWIDDTIVFYSLGNFLSGQQTVNNYNTMVGLMSSLTINKIKKDGKTIITIDNIENDLIYNYHNNYNDFKLISFSSELIDDYLPSYKTVYNAYKDIVTKLDSNMSIKKCYNCE